MTNPYSAIMNYDGKNWYEFLEQICMFDIFEKLLSWYHQYHITDKLIHYILWTYSVESDKIIAGMEPKANKEQIFKLAGLPKELWEQVGLLQHDVIVTTIMNWLAFQEQDVWTQLCVLRDLKTEMQISSVSAIKKSAGEIDYDQKFKNAKYAMDLRGMISDLEKELLQNNANLKDLVIEVKAVGKKQQTTGIENFVPKQG